MIRGPLVALAIASCGADTILWSVPPEVDTWTVAEACDAWNPHAYTQQGVGDDGEHRIVMWPRDAMANGPNVSGETNGKTIRLAPDLDRTQQSLTLTHEMGHALGLKHVDGGGVMAPTATTTYPNEHDLHECRRVGACRKVRSTR